MAVYNLDPSHSSASFTIKHMMIAKVRGSFDQLSGTLTYDPANPGAARAEAKIETASIDTREAQRDAHLKSADFFDIEKFPSIGFVSSKVVSSGDGLKVTGNLTIKGVTKEVVLDVEGPTEEMKDPWGNLKIGVSATTKINRKDFDLTWNAALETGGILVGEEVSISLDLQYVKQK